MIIYLYILKSQKDNGYYAGISKNPEQRLLQHNSGYETSTKNRAPFEIVGKLPFANYKEARKIEKVIKSYTREKIQKFLRKILVRTCTD